MHDSQSVFPLPARILYASDNLSDLLCTCVEQADRLTLVTHGDDLVVQLKVTHVGGCCTERQPRAHSEASLLQRSQLVSTQSRVVDAALEIHFSCATHSEEDCLLPIISEERFKASNQRSRYEELILFKDRAQPRTHGSTPVTFDKDIFHPTQRGTFTDTWRVRSRPAFELA